MHVTEVVIPPIALLMMRTGSVQRQGQVTLPVRRMCAQPTKTERRDMVIVVRAERKYKR